MLGNWWCDGKQAPFSHGGVGAQSPLRKWLGHEGRMGLVPYKRDAQISSPSAM